jgi:N-acetylneuraminic acid mutarotase
MKKLAFLLGLGGVLSVAATRPPRVGTPPLRYRPLPDLPPQQGQPNPGVAGAFAGVSHGALLLAGGANFPNGYPWQGGTKVWQPAIYVLAEKTSSGSPPAP